MKKIIILFICALFISGCDKGVASYEIELSANPSTGYTWKYSVDKENIIQIIEGYALAPDNCPECDGTSIFTVTGIEKGTVTVYFTYNKDWEIDSTNKTAIYEFKVTDDLKVKVNKKSGTYFE